MLCAIIAMQNEADALLKQARTARKYTLFGKDVYEGEAFGRPFRLLLAGVGKTNAASAAMLAVSALKADRLLNFGLAGGISQAAQLGKIFRIARAVQYDFDLSEVNGTPKGTLNEYAEPYFPLAGGDTAFARGALATGDKLTNSLSDLPLLYGLAADVRDMEGGAVAHVAHFSGVPLYSYKAVSNKIGAESVAQYREYTARALDALAENMQTIFGEIDG